MEILSNEMYSLIIEKLFHGLTWYYMFLNRKNVAAELIDLLAVSLVSKDWNAEWRRYAHFPTRGQNLFLGVSAIKRYINLIDKDKKIVWADDGRAGDYEEACNITSYIEDYGNNSYKEAANLALLNKEYSDDAVIVISCDDFIYRCPVLETIGKYNIIISHNDNIYYEWMGINGNYDSTILSNRVQGILRALDIPMYINNGDYKHFDHFWYKETEETPLHAMTYCEDYTDY